MWVVQFMTVKRQKRTTPLAKLLNACGGMVAASTELNVNYEAVKTWVRRDFVTRKNYVQFIAYVEKKGMLLDAAQKQAIITGDWNNVSDTFDTHGVNNEAA